MAYCAEAEVIGHGQNAASDALSKHEVQVTSTQIAIDIVKTIPNKMA